MDTPTVADPGEITETADATGVSFAWPAYKAVGDASHAVAWWAFVITGIVWAVVWFFALAGAASVSGVLCLFGWTVGGAAFFWLLRHVVLPTTPELVRLEADALRYDPGSGPDYLRSCAELPNGKVVPVTPAKAAVVPKAAVRGFTIDRVNDRQRLVVDADGRRFEIGGCLTEAERAWLFAALQKWLGRPVTPPWSREARINKEQTPS